MASMSDTLFLMVSHFPAIVIEESGILLLILFFLRIESPLLQTFRIKDIASTISEWCGICEISGIFCKCTEEVCISSC
jgi:hypothetical protein